MLKAKLCAPAVYKNIISREKLLTKFQQAKECKLILVTAPAGSGKTTAVLDWLGKCGLPYAWLSLDDGDNHPVSFWQYVCAALEDITDGISKDAEYTFSSPEMMKANIHINILIDRLSEISSDFFLVLDDLHLIRDPAILAGLSYLIDYLPSPVHLVLISRTTPEIGLARHRVKWQIQRLNTEDLRFGEEEIFRFYQARGITLENSELKKVESFTEGWAAALVAVTLSIEEGGGRDAIQALSRSSRDIGQYLRDEVISNWRPEKLSFAMKISILDTLWPDLCNAVTGDDHGFNWLEEMAEGNNFITDLDGQRQAYRYHHLFQSFLRKLLQETFPEEISQLYKRAGAWFQEQSLMPEAIDYFLSGGAYQEAFELIEHQTDPLIHKNDFDRLLTWIERLPAEYRENSFKSACIYALYYAELGRLDLSRQWIDRMKALKDGYQYATGTEWIGYSDTVCIMIEANLLIRENNLGFLPLIFSAAETDGGRYFKMPEYNDFNTADIYFYRCPINRLSGLFKEAPDQFVRMADSYRRMISKNPGYAPLAVGEYLYESNRIEEAQPYLLKALEEAREAICPGALVPVIVDIARLKRAGGDISGAFAVVEEGRKQLQSIGKTHWLYLLDAFRCRLYIDIGNTDKVREWYSARKLSIFTEIDRVREFELIVYARVLILINRTQDARLLLQRLLAFTGESKRLHSQVEVLNILALLSFRDNHTRLALRYLDESLSLGLNEGYVRSYLDELAPMAQILRAYLKSRGKLSGDHFFKERKAFAASLLEQIRDSLLQTAAAHAEVAAEVAEKLSEQFTAQEKKVLELMVNADTNKMICEKLGIGLRTVKTHTGNIYTKLGVKNRVQCIKLVRELGLL
ncbi:regulatory protein, LuxR [Desulfosporosinus sp. I2]|uniref:LuxR C-terminal-related transcriptional regulator n=1 Tax=Desulfosporosinus sp. I2 TaxID=1617025 RepID=UPI0005EF9FB6|nr:LuxR C-terminal-related transcriptional regulator [Desulfosporosinus sp. I2]KJR47573.1 regulatory protein, LuxR [Desulfosporosinus sp. I2]